MDLLTKEYDILDKAIGAIYRETDLQLNIIDRDVSKYDKRIDALIQMPDNGIKLYVEIKKWATQANYGAIINQVKNIAEPNHGLLVADYINPKMGERLKEADIQFIDTVGNAYINQRPIYIYIKGNKPQKDITTDNKPKTGKAFQPTGMKIIFAFLRNKELINAPYREIADQAQVALGAVGWVIRDLIAQGYILEGINKKQRKLADFALLLNRWVEDYPYKLKEKYKIGVFTTDNPYWWETINLEKFDAQWGGEIAAAKYNNYLNPKDAIVYINQENVKDLLQAARLKKPEPHERANIRIELVEPFWNKKITDTNYIETTEQANLAPPIITYADLIETGDARNLDTAKRLREKYIR
ncbi:type IV toxin-antitoxin system AbiEi family antitoxin [uncultured Cocleimonas sp.]|uniref:type IV toxin-antitoxin system AbiEi family antitoxin n=1 Tax=uncultured Cocleimonas sp. TaxID=1051587 RepID=UPI002625B842|nr:type IV toxin-antitoxin system AbiEi family antitoxin [uncultured Cocleimonas sp.]